MKKLTILVLALFLTAGDAFGSPLIFQAVKEIRSERPVELGSFDAKKFSRIRIGIKVNSGGISGMAKSSAISGLIQKRAELAAGLKDLKSKFTDEHPEVRRVQNELAAVNEEIGSQDDSMKSAAISNVFISGVEGADEILLFGFEEINVNRSVVIDVPPSRISVKVAGSGMYSLYVWGE